MQKINLSLGSSLPCLGPLQAAFIAQSGISDPVFGEIMTNHIQVCPQNFSEGAITEESLDKLQSVIPDTKIRLHANVRILAKTCQYDAGTIDLFPEYTKRLIGLLKHLGNPYTLHAANNGTPLEKQFQAVISLADSTGVPVGIEGLYPVKYSENTLKVWDDYVMLLNSECAYAIDLSHMNIIRHKFGAAPNGLLEALLQNERCIEVHVSGNDGKKDSHLQCDGTEWWLPLLGTISDSAVIFYEGRIPKEQYQ